MDEKCGVLCRKISAETETEVYSMRHEGVDFILWEI